MQKNKPYGSREKIKRNGINMKRIILLLNLCFHAMVFNAQVCPELEKYYFDFLSEAKSRNVSCDTRGLKVLGFPSAENLKYINDLFITSGRAMEKSEWAGITFFSNESDEVFVFINASAFYARNEAYRELTVYHELSHALLGIKHPGGIIMNDTIDTDEQVKLYINNKKKALDEMFSHAIINN